MRALDPRLLGRTRAARVALGVDVVLGLAATGCVLGQAAVVAALVAGAFDGRPVGEQGRLLACWSGSSPPAPSSPGRSSRSGGGRPAG